MVVKCQLYFSIFWDSYNNVECLNKVKLFSFSKECYVFIVRGHKLICARAGRYG